MGWSCRSDAGATMRAMSDACVAQTGSSNSYKDIRRALMCFWEVSRIEHTDGAITGGIYAMISNDRADKIGSFRIGPCGVIERAPSALVQLVEHYHGRTFGKASHKNCVECYPDKNPN